MRAVASCFRNAAKLSILVTDRNHPERTSGLGIISAGYTGNAGRNNIGAAPLAARSAKLQRSHPLNRKTRMAAPEEINADMLAFWNGKGGHTWVARQEHTDITLTPVTDALLGFAAPRAGERVVDIGCGCGAWCRQPRQCRLAAGRSCDRRAG